MGTLQAGEGNHRLEFGVAGVPKILVKIYNGDGKVLRRKTIPIRGRLKIWLFAAHKTLQFISAAREAYGEHARQAVVELEGVAQDDAFEYYKAWVRKYSPIPVSVYIIEKRPA